MTSPADRTMGRPAGRRRRTLPVALVLVAGIGLLVALTAVVLLALGMSAGRRNTFDLLNEKAVLLVNSLETVVRHHLDPARAQLAFVAREIEAGRLDPQDQDRLSDILLGAMAAAPQIAGTSHWNADLRQTAIRRRPDGSPEIFRQTRDRSPLVRRRAAEARAAQQAFWGELVYVRGRLDGAMPGPGTPPGPGMTLVNLAQPLHRENGFAGFLGMAVTMAELSELMLSAGDLFGATAFILHGPDRVLAHANLMSPHPDLAPGQPTVAVDRVGDLVLAAPRTPVEGFTAAAQAGVRVEAVDLFDETFVVFSREISGYGPVPWIVGAHLPADQVDRELDRLVISGLAGVIVLLLAIAAAVLLGLAIARPTRRLAAVAERVGRLDLAGIQTPDGSRIRELDDQIRAFDAMLNGVRWLETYVPRRLVRHLLARDGRIESGERNLTLMFTDITGFTALSEHMPAAETAGLLNDHFAGLGAAIDAEAGTIDKYIGDGLMAFWGAPDEQADHADRACRAALAIRDSVEQKNAARRQAGQPVLRLRIGIHTGPVVVGNIGAPERMNYTIVGDTVNAGQRVETLVKEVAPEAGVAILTSEATVAHLTDKAIRVVPVGQFRLKGRRAAVTIYRLL